MSGIDLDKITGLSGEDRLDGQNAPIGTYGGAEPLWAEALRRGWERLRRRLRFVLVGILLPVLLAAGTAACGGGHKAGSVKSYGRDGYMGLTNSNPRIPLTGTSQNYGDDGAFVKQTLKQLPGIRDTRVFFNGTSLSVRLKADPKLDGKGRLTLQKKAQSLLSYNMPRYHVSVRVTK